MNHFAQTIAQTEATGLLNTQLEAEKLMKRMHQSGKPAASAHEAVNNWIVANRYGYRKQGEPLLRLTEIGRRYVREVLL